MEQHEYPALFIHYPLKVPDVIATSVVSDIQNTKGYADFTTEFIKLAKEERAEEEEEVLTEDDLMNVNIFLCYLLFTLGNCAVGYG